MGLLRSAKAQLGICVTLPVQVDHHARELRAAIGKVAEPDKPPNGRDAAEKEPRFDPRVNAAARPFDDVYREPSAWAAADAKRPGAPRGAYPEPRHASVGAKVPWRHTIAADMPETEHSGIDRPVEWAFRTLGALCRLT